MMHTRLLKLYRTYLCGFYSFGNIAVYIPELRLCNLNIHSSQYVDSGSNRLPAEGYILGNIKIEILVDSLKCLFRTSYGISLVYLIKLIITCV